MIIERKIHGVIRRIEIPKKTCPDCGVTFDPRTPASKRCPSCQATYAERLKARRAAERKADKMAKIRAKCDRINDKKERAAAEAAQQETVPQHPCPYCGHMTNHPYCNSCHREGFDNVHRMFGYTNGWDSKPRKRVKIASGWRGHGVGGNICRCCDVSCFNPIV